MSKTKKNAPKLGDGKVAVDLQALLFCVCVSIVVVPGKILLSLLVQRLVWAPTDTVTTMAPHGSVVGMRRIWISCCTCSTDARKVESAKVCVSTLVLLVDDHANGIPLAA